MFGGFCYLNNSAIAANELSKERQGSAVGYRLSPRQRCTGHFLQPLRRVHDFHPWPSSVGVSQLLRLHRRNRRRARDCNFNRNFPLLQGRDEKQYLEVLDKALADRPTIPTGVAGVVAGLRHHEGRPHRNVQAHSRRNGGNRPAASAGSAIPRWSCRKGDIRSRTCAPGRKRSSTGCAGPGIELDLSRWFAGRSGPLPSPCSTAPPCRFRLSLRTAVECLLLQFLKLCSRPWAAVG